MNRDLATHLGCMQTIKPALISATKEGALVDRQGTKSLMHVVSIGDSANTLNGTNYIRLVIQEGDLADGSDMAPVTHDVDPNLAIHGEFVEGQPAGVFAVIDDAAEANDAFCVGYRGCKRYSRVVVEFVGAPGDTDVSATAMIKDNSYPSADRPAGTGT